MKGAIIILDGLGDLPCSKLNGKTPLEAAVKPNLNYFATRGKLGFMFSVNEKVVPESDSAVLSILGNKLSSSYRGYFEAVGAGIKIGQGDLALRINFGTIDNLKNRKIIDRRAGRTLTTKEANKLAEEINNKVKLPCKFLFKNTLQHRGVLILRGGFSDNISNTDPAYHVHGQAKISDLFKFSIPLDEEDNTKYTSNILNEFIEQSHLILDKHPVNVDRRKRGLLPANMILTRDASVGFPKVKKYYKWAGISYMPLEVGIAADSGMKVFSFPYPEMSKHDVYQNFYDGLKAGCDFAKKTIKKENKNFSYFYVHFKETDAPGHDDKPEEKKRMIEFLDREFFSFLRELVEKKKIKIIITADHSTPCNVRGHSSDPVPFLFCDWKENEKKEFSEKEALKGELGKIYGKNALSFFS
ncbi:2,3-bisphosphoglycerate-independent phosphoglycerate mutase [Candidatus Pacearchaeota archaeon]|nr:2,3-bisphosphoglycerate-independent phosphoglycerate mutase [Candidatus Pacearchaeota archaeon]